nr:hypothetical protein [Moraxella osloensis]
MKAHYNSLTVGKEYSVLNIRIGVEVIDDAGSKYYWRANHFEPVLDSAENPLQDIELTDEFEAVEPKFKVGDKVYLFGTDYIEEITKIIGANVYLAGADFDASVSVKEICHATPENYERLQAMFTDIEFERPPKPLTGIELAKKLIAKGHNYLVVDTVIGIRVLTRLEGNTLIDSNNVRLDELDDITPLNDETGEPLTESVLDE